MFVELTSTMASDSNTQQISSLGSFYFISATEVVANSSSLTRNPYQKWTEEQRFKIWKCAAENAKMTEKCDAEKYDAAARKFTTKANPLNESTVQRFSTKKKLNKHQIKSAMLKMRWKFSFENSHYCWVHWTKGFNDMVLLATRSKGGLTSSASVIATTKTLIDLIELINLLKTLDLDSFSWAKNLFKRMGL